MREEVNSVQSDCKEDLAEPEQEIVQEILARIQSISLIVAPFRRKPSSSADASKGEGGGSESNTRQ